MGLQILDHLKLVAGRYLGQDVVGCDADLAGDRVGDGPVVPGEQDRGEPEPTQPGDGLGRCGLDGVGHHQDGPRLPVDGHGDGGAPLAGLCIDQRGKVVGQLLAPLRE